MKVVYLIISSWFLDMFIDGIIKENSILIYNIKKFGRFYSGNLVLVFILVKIDYKV